MIDPLDQHVEPDSPTSVDGRVPLENAELDALQDAYLASDRGAERPWPPKPGVFVVIWPAYLLVGGIAAASPYLMARYVDDSIALPAIRFLLGTFVLGLTILLPMVRLSQRRSTDPIIEASMDAFSLLLPLQPLLWFMVVPPIAVRASRILAIDLHMAFWTMLVGAWVGLTLRHEHRRGTGADAIRRMCAMAGIVAAQTLGPLGVLVAISLGFDVPESSWMLSPCAGVLELASRPREPVSGEEWLGMGAVGLVAVGVWWTVLAERRSVLSGERHRDSSVDVA